MDDLQAIAAGMRAYAFANPFNPLQAATQCSPTARWTKEVRVYGQLVRVTFTVMRLPSCSIAQLSFSDCVDHRPMRAAISELLCKTFFHEADVVREIPVSHRNASYRHMGMPTIAHPNTNQYFCIDPREDDRKGNS